MPSAIVGRWGRNLAVRLPAEVARVIGVNDGERVEIETRDGTIVVRRATAHPTLAELFAGKSEAEWRADYAGAFDWGDDVGREIVEA